MASDTAIEQPVTVPPPATPPARATPGVTVIRPRSGWSADDLRELWQYRELLYYLTLRDIKLRYKQTILGTAWAFVQPASAVLVFVLFFGRMGGLSAGVENYTLFVLAAVLPWTFFSNAVTTASNSLVANERLVTKTYFPRVLLPVSCIGAAGFDLMIGLSLLVLGMAISGSLPTAAVVFAPVLLAGLAATALGVGILMSALIVAQRDFRHLLTYGVQLWMFATPCIYLTPEKIGPTAKAWLPLNPVYGLLTNFRACVLGTEPDLRALAISAAVGLTIMTAGLWYFRRVERSLADTI